MKDEHKVNWTEVRLYMESKGYTWSVLHMKEEFRKQQSGDYVSFTAKDTITNSILPQIKSYNETNNRNT